jgi:glycosidase
MGKDSWQSIREKLFFLYGKERAEETLKKLKSTLKRYEKKIPVKHYLFTEKDVVLITYGNAFLKPGEKPLQTLSRFCSKYLKGIFSTIHVLPFFPYSSDDGFSVIDYKRVNHKLGSWRDIDRLGAQFELMFDAVINHISKESREFKGFRNGDERYAEYFIVTDEKWDLSRVFRPRALPLLTEFETKMGKKNVWTTFSADQIDLNFSNPDVLLFIIDVLLFYISHGASIIRMDAIAYLWKESGTSCLHLPQTHIVVKLFRDILDRSAPHVKIITETNVPHKENISYFGNGNDEAHVVYNFALPPLSSYALITGDAKSLSLWARSLDLPGSDTFFYNFTASHDGIGMLPATDLISLQDIEDLAEYTVDRGGKLGYKNNPDGTKTVYELNISLFDLLSDPDSEEPIERKVQRFVASQAIALSLKGIPAIYYHSLVGSQNYYDGVRETGMNRSINREKLSIVKLEEELATSGSRRNLVFEKLSHLIKVRAQHPAFHPEGEQRVLVLHENVFVIERHAPSNDEQILALINCSGKTVELEAEELHGRDALTRREYSGRIGLEPFGILWLQQSPRNS